MARYPTGKRVVSALYELGSDNPYLAAMPSMLSKHELFKAILSDPPLPANLSAMSSAQRRQWLPVFQTVYMPMDYMYVIYDQLYRAIRTSYMTRMTVEVTRQVNELFSGRGGGWYTSQAESGSILGTPGLGKTSAILRVLSAMPQVICHEKFQNKPFYAKQVLYLRVECPSDCSVKSLAYGVIAALDRAIESNYTDTLANFRASAASSLAAKTKILCATHNVGVIIVDEIQNVLDTSIRSHQVKPLVKYLVELTNDTGTAVYFVGTPAVETLFAGHEHLKRRTRGLRLLPLRPDGLYRSFLDFIFRYQVTPATAPVTEALARKLYDHSGGVPSYIVKIFMEAQDQALLNGSSCIDVKTVQAAVKTLAIQVPKTFSGGTHLSDITVDGDLPETVPDEPLTEVSRQYAVKRGRKPAERDACDLLRVMEMSERLKHCNLSSISKMDANPQAPAADRNPRLKVRPTGKQGQSRDSLGVGG